MVSSPMHDYKIAYFSMEIGIRNDIPTYSGGLGVLAGDTIRSSADLSVPMVAVTLVSRKGYLQQKLSDSGDQTESTDEWNPKALLDLAPKTVEIEIERGKVTVQAWIYDYKSTIGGTVPILFLDTDVEGNAAEDRRITDTLYGGDDQYRLKQEAVLGIGGTRMLEALGYRISKYHMNEGHSALLTLELLQRYEMDIDRVRRHCIFTTHTPVEAAFDRFSYELVRQVLGSEFPTQVIREIGGDDKLNMTLLALNLSGFQNGVTKAHMKLSLKLFPHYAIRAITNGVHSNTWTSQSFHKLFDKYIPGWASEPDLLVRIAKVPLCDIWAAHMENKKNLIAYIEEKTGEKLSEDALTLGFARRTTGYKRAKLIFSDLKKLRDINKARPLQLVFAGKAHPRDIGGKDLIREIFWYKRQLRDELKVVYLENYDMQIAAKLTSGVDVWLNTPLPPMEASGTSGMKAAHNGVLNFSVLDGWWIEGCMEGITGWAIGPSPEQEISEEERRKSELDDLFNKLRYLVAPKFYDDRDAWTAMMKSSIGKVAYYFNTDRMMRRYITEAYLR
ncbi:MAG: alpha-glucan family phosphorylase [Candidatus Bathyarchaeota archaeon]|nr:alpha-glucan family phosphorylase [Candidatus Bathyarchaeota archaeon]